MKPKIFLATKNKSKYPFMRKFCNLVDCEFITPYDIKGKPEFEEHGNSLKENAEIKALNWSYHTNAIVLADDSGFDVPALQGEWKKELSKRNVGGDHVSDDQKRKRLLDLMKNLSGKERKIIWSEAIALAKNGKLLRSITYKSTPGYILKEEKLGNKTIEGAFLSNLEYKPKFNKVFSELTNEEIEENDKEMLKKFRKFIKDCLTKKFQNRK